MRIASAVFLAVFAGMLLSPAYALKFEPVPQKDLPPGIESALWIRDCGLFRGEQCTPAETQFYAGDAERLARHLRGRTYAEIWLASNGGNLAEGIAIASLLRQHQATTRVPGGFSCVSACTVAFLGGVFRFVDETATYEVHAASRYSLLSSSEKVVSGIRDEPEPFLRVVWQQNLDSVRDFASGLFMVFQRAVHPLGRLPAGQEATTERQLALWRRSWDPMDYARSEQLRADAARIRREGAPAVQDILMRLERDAMGLATDALRARTQALGSRASAALDLLEAMYSSRITSTAPLSQQTMRQLGIVTVLFDPTGAR